MKRIVPTEEPNAQADRCRLDPPQAEHVRRQKATSLGFSVWRRMGVRLVLSRAKRRAKHAR